MSGHARVHYDLTFISFISQLEASEKGHGDMSVSLGLVQPDDILLKDWNGSILGPPGVSLLYFGTIQRSPKFIIP
jgi:hypothetical protein